MEFLFRPFTPPPSLAGYVHQTFYAKGQIPYRTDKILPNGLASLIVTLGTPHRVGKSPQDSDNPAFDRCWLSGLQTTPQFHTPTGRTHVIGLLFEPLGLSEIFGIDAAALADTAVDARARLPADFLRFVDGLNENAGSPESHKDLHAWLDQNRRGDTPGWLKTFFDQIVIERGAVDLKSLYETSGYSSRYIVDAFRRATGVTPKVLCRIYRLMTLLEAIDPAQDVNWTALAHEHGFFDQAHFNHEFRKLTGLYPTEYLTQRRRDMPELGQGDNVSFAPHH